MKKINQLDLNEYYAEQYKKFNIDNIKATPPIIQRQSMKIVDLKTQVSFMPKDNIKKLIIGIGNVIELLFPHEKA